MYKYVYALNMEMIYENGIFALIGLHGFNIPEQILTFN